MSASGRAPGDEGDVVPGVTEVLGELRAEFVERGRLSVVADDDDQVTLVEEEGVVPVTADLCRVLGRPVVGGQFDTRDLGQVASSPAVAARFSRYRVPPPRTTRATAG
ncbi:hypothetical protein [Streptomyces cadmiisoli]|uniref:hypothetical protein n=1 Tax=Streptomyces cadmiisoli TaxID=2184053 RepID=UPI00365CA71E